MAAWISTRQGSVLTVECSIEVKIFRKHTHLLYYN